MNIREWVDAYDLGNEIPIIIISGLDEESEIIMQEQTLNFARYIVSKDYDIKYKPYNNGEQAMKIMTEMVNEVELLEVPPHSHSIIANYLFEIWNNGTDKLIELFQKELGPDRVGSMKKNVGIIKGKSSFKDKNKELMQKFQELAESSIILVAMSPYDKRLLRLDMNNLDRSMQELKKVFEEMRNISRKASAEKRQKNNIDNSIEFDENEILNL